MLEVMESTDTQNQKLSPKFFFASLFILVWLITTVTSFLNLVFGLLNKRFPDALNAVYSYGYNTYELAAVRGALATLIVIFPVFMIVSYFWTKLVAGKLGRIDLVIKKWMLYLIVFLASIVITVDLITLVRYFVEGEITTRFILKVVVTLVVALLVGLYYLFELRGEKNKKSLRVTFAIIASLLVGVAIVAGFMTVGSPAQQRLLRFDERRIQDLQSIQWQVVNYWQYKERLPQTLADLQDPLLNYTLPVDPEFTEGKTYEYNALGDLTFELCATFALPMPEGWLEYYDSGKPIPLMYPERDGGVTSYPYPGPTGTNESWSHEGGRTCFERTIDTDLFQPFSKVQ
ncbi:MAG: DUF5671 domain-containing protein [Patescibacteria group bacterium]|nr:DUF5671 domain-containing protein [Patescibacteria group bacterium]